MKKLFTRFRNTYFAPHFDLRIKLFHVLAIGGTVISLLMAISGLIINSGFVNVAVNLGRPGHKSGLGFPRNLGVGLRQ